MEENKLNFSVNKDETLVVDADKKMLQKVTKIYNNLTMSLGFCHEQLKEGTLTVGMKETHLSLAEHYVMDFLKEMNYDGILKKESEKRHAEIRGLNEQNRDLRKQLGEKVSNEDFRERAKNMCDIIRRWWNIHGFGHTSEIHFTEYGYVKVKFSGSVTEAYYDESRDTTVKDKVQYLKGLGFEFDEKNEAAVINDKNINQLTDLIVAKFPSAKIEEITLCPSSRSKRTYRDITVYIYNLDEIKS